MSDSIFSEEELKIEIIRVMKTLYGRGLVSALGGNVSARIPGSDTIWITPSGIFKGDLKPDDLVKISLDGDVIEGFMRPSIEWPMHTVIYRVRPDVNAVIHAHNPITTGLALAGIELKPITVEAVVTLRSVPVIPFAYPGTDELAKLVAERVMGVRALILQNHGVVALGYNLVEAEAIVETLEEVATTQLVAMLASGGREPLMIPEKDRELISRLYLR
ncbi:MAG: class II aldolase/adducin family protein [Nitrososphaerota archaeon]|nr:class II aldolase/adducin family protein [Candidatus Bathyarchaeota archaeon]MDW8061939.1 class II aldolase/adducin family protein [Nitrososphaerota archaeon]